MRWKSHDGNTQQVSCPQSVGLLPFMIEVSCLPPPLRVKLVFLSIPHLNTPVRALAPPERWLTSNTPTSDLAHTRAYRFHFRDL